MHCIRKATGLWGYILENRGNMSSKKAKKLIDQFLSLGDIKINGSDPWDIQVKDSRFYERVIKYFSLGFGESYMENWWECSRIDELFFRLLRINVEDRVQHDWHLLPILLRNKFTSLLSYLFNYQSRTRSFEVAERHYNIGNDLFQAMLDPSLNYSCGYWKNSENLAQAQLAKLKLTCEKLQLQPGMRVLDIGCGWGGFAKYAAEHYQVSVLGVTVSEQQQQLAQQLCAGFPVEIRLQDYRSITEKFDRICSIGMFEHVGYKNYRNYMQVAHRCLKDDGLFLLHTIGSRVSVNRCDEWINKYIFPNGMLPSIQQLGHAIEKLFVMEDWHNFGSDYDKTLMAWHHNFNAHWPALKTQYDERFHRMWNYYLLSCAGAFRARDTQLWQLVLTKQGIVGGYHAPR